mgnify:CR=1 FL=1
MLATCHGASAGASSIVTSPWLVSSFHRWASSALPGSTGGVGAVPTGAAGPGSSPISAVTQVRAAARNVGTEDIAALVRRHTEGPDLRVFGQPRVNVLELNLVLAQLPTTP